MREEKRFIKGQVAAKRRLGSVRQPSAPQAGLYDEGQIERVEQRLQGIHSPRPEGEQPEHVEAAGKLVVLQERGREGIELHLPCERAGR